MGLQVNVDLVNKPCNGDAFMLLPSIPSHSVDLVLTDPPYDLSKLDKSFIHTELLRISKGTVIVFSPPENQWVMPAEQYLFWVKPISTKNTSVSYSRFVEMIFVYRHGTWNADRHWSQYTNVFTDLVDNSNIHPYRKPPSLVERLILNHTNPGDLILDPFSGSFVTYNAARRFDRNCIAIEKDPQYMKHAVS